MGDIVNLRRARKRLERGHKEAEAAANRLAFGIKKSERRRITNETEKADRELEAHRLVPPDER